MIVSKNGSLVGKDALKPIFEGDDKNVSFDFDLPFASESLTAATWDASSSNIVFSSESNSGSVASAKFTCDSPGEYVVYVTAESSSYKQTASVTVKIKKKGDVW